MEILIIDDFHESLVDLLSQSGFDCKRMEHSSDEQIWEALRSAEGIVLRSRISLRKAEIDRCPKLKFIGRVGAGLEHIDVEYARHRGIEVLSSPEGNRQAVAEHALAMLLAMLNNVVRSDAQVRAGKWLRKENEGVELQGLTVGIVGYGNTGSAFAQVLSGFGVNILAYDKYLTDHAHKAPMQRIFKEADVVSIHLPLNTDTRYLVNDEWIGAFQKPFYFINTSRGAIVRTSSVLDALNNGKMSGACLDVLEFETENLRMPAGEDLPEVARRLFEHPRVVLTPHTAGLTVQSYRKLSVVLAEKIIARFPQSA